MANENNNDVRDDATDPESESFQSLVNRSIAAWGTLKYVGKEKEIMFPKLIDTLRNIHSLEDLLKSHELFWFFQLRESFVEQKLLQKWNPDSLNSYILLPLHYGFANNQDCFYISHYWNTPEHPDPQGHDMRLFLEDIGQTEWSYVWVDWTCLPQTPRTEAQKYYFKKMLRFIPALVRDCAFEWRFPAFAPRAWILYEVAEYMLNHSNYIITDDIEPFLSHVTEMVHEGVRPILTKYGYACTNGSDIPIITGWLEILVLLFKLIPNTGIRQEMLDWLNKDEVGSYYVPNFGLEIDKHKGIVTERDGTKHNFTPVFNIRPII
ncbi:hypothetical protein BDZ94DRAFT_1275292 [Collybia nuda]|uniref:Uncharacterized protein n=1 Tax=Collybia nuda TaxID=64659 RepID=A0A9P6CC06_9AGAR|nr:hypothetical protein BDZ94DRAFT_1275292 [Collybia nuda]